MPFLIQGKTNWKYILIVVILAVIVSGGIFYCYSTFKGKEWPPIIPPPKEINIFTDKTEYEYVNEPEGVIKLTVKNNLDKSICLESCNTYYLLKRRDSDWEEVDKKLCEFNSIKECIQPSETKTFEYIRTWKEEGIYKFAIPIFFEEEIKNFSSKYNEIVKITYSNEFKIKTKEVAGETANWKTYRNEEYGFEINYPDGLAPKVYHSSLVDFSGVINLYIHGFPEKYAVTIQISICPGCYSSVENWINSLGTIEEGKEIIYQEELKSVISKEKIKIGDQEGYKIITPSGAFIGLVKNNTLYEIHQPYPVECRLGECEILYQMLSTFRFLE
jgi:hypothetical protein